MNQARSARWTAITVMAPLTAAAFAGTTWWAETHDPREATAAVTATASSDVAAPEIQTVAATTGDPQVETIQKQAEAVLAQARKVRRETRQIEREMAQVTSSEPAASGSSWTAAATSPGDPTTRGSSQSSNQGSSSVAPAPKPAPAPAPAPVAVPAPAPAPPADTTTGAS